MSGGHRYPCKGWADPQHCTCPDEDLTPEQEAEAQAQRQDDAAEEAALRRWEDSR